MFTYRKATTNDLEWIIGFKKKMFIESGHEFLIPKEFDSTVLADYKKLYLVDHAIHFVAEFNDKPVAIVGAFIKSDIPYRYFEPNNYGFIGDVYTDRNYRGKGLATKLNEAAINWLKKQGVLYVKLLASDAGRSIYERLGFTKTDDMELTL